MGSVDFARLRQGSAVKLFVFRRQRAHGKVKVFTEHEVTADSVMASACLAVRQAAGGHDPPGASPNQSVSTIEPVCGIGKRKPENCDQRRGPGSQRTRAEILENCGPETRPACLTCRNVDVFATRGNDTAETSTGWLTMQSGANPSQHPNSLITGNLTGNFRILGLFLRFSVLICEQIPEACNKIPYAKEQGIAVDPLLPSLLGHQRESELFADHRGEEAAHRVGPSLLHRDGGPLQHCHRAGATVTGAR